ncbi:DUF3299 domain-containing protein [Dyadobacter bucti]|uniref:DUF3299 domain-containing protein n=1 Tax=Dyadobacter bucti TaxID=2572203 RepID=UPI001107F6CB|nr:DUF3299 domain-containing protein [Dyadobacter bucti]
MKIAVLLFLLVTGFISAGPAVTHIDWKKLSDVRFTKKLNKEVSMYFLYPTFGQTVRNLQNKEVQIKGYMIPVDETENIYVLSSQPMAACFFCGGAGPESIIELQFKNRRRKFKTDEVKNVRGMLQLNNNDIEHLNYILKNAEVVE